MYSDLYIKPKRQSPFLMVGIVMAVLVSFGFFALKNTSVSTRASKITIRRNEVVNILARQAGVFWQSEIPDKGWVIYGKDDQHLSKIALDERDTADNRTVHAYHYVLLKDLQADTTYYYKIVSNNELVSAADNEAFYFKTARNYTISSSPQPAYGRIVLPSGEPAADTFVIFHYKNSYSLLALTKSTGEWLIPLQFGVDKTDNKIIDIVGKDQATLEIFNDQQKTTIITVIDRASPIPQTIILGKNYQFTDTEQVLSATTNNTETANANYSVSVLYPKDNAIVPGLRALIRGTGIPGKIVTVSMNSKPTYSTQTTVDQDGKWVVSNSSSFLPGTYIVTITTEDKNNKKVGFKRQFTLIKSGEQVLAESTSAATLAPTQMPTVAPTLASLLTTPSPTATASALLATATPTATVSATLFPTVIPTNIYIPENVATGVPPASGNSSNNLPFIITGLGFLIVGAGLVLIF